MPLHESLFPVHHPCLGVPAAPETQVENPCLRQPNTLVIGHFLQLTVGCGREFEHLSLAGPFGGSCSVAGGLHCLLLTGPLLCWVG